MDTFRRETSSASFKKQCGLQSAHCVAWSIITSNPAGSANGSNAQFVPAAVGCSRTVNACTGRLSGRSESRMTKTFQTTKLSWLQLLQWTEASWLAAMDLCRPLWYPEAVTMPTLCVSDILLTMFSIITDSGGLGLKHSESFYPCQTTRTSVIDSWWTICPPTVWFVWHSYRSRSWSLQSNKQQKIVINLLLSIKKERRNS